MNAKKKCRCEWTKEVCVAKEEMGVVVEMLGRCGYHHKGVMIRLVLTIDASWLVPQHWVGQFESLGDCISTTF